MRYRRKRMNRHVFRLLCILLIMLTVFLLIDARIRPMIAATAIVQAQNYAAVKAGKDIPQIIRSTDTDYGSLAEIIRDDDGNIVSIQLNTMQINLLKSMINSSVASALSGLRPSELGIPAGSLTGLALLNGRGPVINAAISITGSAQTHFEDCFDSAGINQTRHRIYLKTTVTMLIVFPDKTLTAAYTYHMLVAQTIIVGRTPEFFAGITQK